MIPCEENAELLKELEYGALSAKRKLQRCCASVHVYELEGMIQKGIAKKLPGDVFILASPDYYSEETGLNIHENFDYFL